jgi:hypothetical protein
MNEESALKMFMDDLFSDVALAIERARDIRKDSRKGEIKRDAEFIEQTLIGVAEKLADKGQRAKQQLHSLIKSD